MKKLILILAAALLVSCATGKREIVRDPLFEGNYIVYGPEGKEAYVIADPLFEGNFLVFLEPK